MCTIKRQPIFITLDLPSYSLLPVLTVPSSSMSPVPPAAHQLRFSVARRFNAFCRLLASASLQFSCQLLVWLFPMWHHSKPFSRAWKFCICADGCSARKAMLYFSLLFVRVHFPVFCYSLETFRPLLSLPRAVVHIAGGDGKRPFGCPSPPSWGGLRGEPLEAGRRRCV